MISSFWELDRSSLGHDSGVCFLLGVLNIGRTAALAPTNARPPTPFSIVRRETPADIRPPQGASHPRDRSPPGRRPACSQNRLPQTRDSVEILRLDNGICGV